MATRRSKRSRSATADPPALGAVRVDDVVHVDLAGRSVVFRVAPPPDVDRARSAAAAHTAPAAPWRSSRRCPDRSSASTLRPARTVEAGDPFVTLEAMKMEHVSWLAPGRVAEIAVTAVESVAPATRGGDQVDRAPRRRPSPRRSMPKRRRAQDTRGHRPADRARGGGAPRRQGDGRRRRSRDPRRAPRAPRARPQAPRRRGPRQPRSTSRVDELGRIEIEIARIERAMDRPRG